MQKILSLNPPLMLAKSLLDEGDCTLALVSGEQQCKFDRRGVKDLLCLLDEDPALLKGAYIADKVIGKAAAALMIQGGVTAVYGRIVTRDAAAMLKAAGVTVAWGRPADYVANRDHTGRCPIDTICAHLSDVEAMVSAIREFSLK